MLMILVDGICVQNEFIWQNKYRWLLASSSLLFKVLTVHYWTISLLYKRRVCRNLHAWLGLESFDKIKVYLSFKSVSVIENEVVSDKYFFD